MIQASIFPLNLGAYTCGELVGGWVDIHECVDFEDFCGQIRKVTRNAEEILISDAEGDVDLGVREFESLDDIWEKVQIIGEASDPEAVAGYLSYYGWDMSYADQFEDAYCGFWDSLEDYAIDYYESVYGEFKIPGFRIEVDLVAWECDHFTVDHGRGVHVFRSF